MSISEMNMQEGLPLHWLEADPRDILTWDDGIRLPYRTKTGITHLQPTQHPVHRQMNVLLPDGGYEHWVQQIDTENPPSHSKHYVWTNLGVGIALKKATGPRAFVYYVALGHLSGYPFRDVLRFAFNFGTTKARRRRATECAQKEFKEL